MTAAAAAQTLPIEPDEVENLGPAGAHWVWVNDIAFFGQTDGQALLVDGDSGRMLGMLSTGFSFTALVLPKEPGVIYSPETYYSRGTRGLRTDVVTIYDSHRLQPLGEVAVPPKRASLIPMRSAAVLTDDDRFLLIYNFTPAQSVSVVDTHTRVFVGEIETSGCALIYPTGPRTFFSICSDGALLLTTLGEDGKAANRVRSAPLFDGMKDPLSEKAVRAGDTWLFASLEGTIYPIRSSAKGVKVEEKWPLFTAAERALGWRTGGLQHLALHRGSGRLFALVHRGGPETHKDAGGDIWVYSVAERKQLQQIAARNKVMSIQVSQDAQPLLFACSLESNRLDVYDATSGAYLRTVDSLGQTPSIMVTP